jgi:hypothetical protein
MGANLEGDGLSRKNKDEKVAEGILHDSGLWDEATSSNLSVIQ